MRYPIPQKSAQAWFDHRNQPRQNPGLIFERFIPDLSALSPEAAKEDPGKIKKESLEAIVNAQKYADRDLLHGWNQRWQKTVEADHGVCFTLSTDWRLIAGLGRKGSLEVGFTFHRYGFPILPGSGIKGLARAWAFYQIAGMLKIEGESLKKLDELLSEADPTQYTKELESLNPSEEAKEFAGRFRVVFGDTGRAGQAIFFDAIPEKLPKLDLDIINPHYPDYYQGDKAPANWQSPRPVVFLTVAAGQKFRFAVGWRGQADADLLKEARNWLEEGLINLGAGGKTSAGYGYFKPGDQKPQQTPDSQEKAGQAAQASLDAAKISPGSLKDLTWQRGKVDKSRQKVAPLNMPDQYLSFKTENVLPKGFTPGAKIEVEFAVETLPDGKQRVWVKQLYFKVE